MNDQCGCCEGTEKLTPTATANRPGLDALAYRAGTHAAFLETMKARLSSFHIDIPREELGPDGEPRVLIDRIHPLSGLTTRESDDAAIALLDSWAMVGDVLTFYQERIANEGYIRTAIERRSVLELARLIGYSLRPGVAASVFLALTLDKGSSINLKPGEVRAQSVPGPGELPQTFENSEDLDARAEWNTLGLRMSLPQTQEVIDAVRVEDKLSRLYLKGVASNLAQNDPLLIDFGRGETPVLFRVMAVSPEAASDRTLVKMQHWIQFEGTSSVKKLEDTIAELSTEALPQAEKATVQNALALLQDLNDLIDAGSGLTVLVGGATTTIASLQTILDGLFPTATLIRPLLEKMIAALKDWIDVVQETEGPQGPPGGNGEGLTDELRDVVLGLVKPASVPPRNSLHLERDINLTFRPKADTGLQLVGSFAPDLKGPIQAALTNVTVTAENKIRVYALRAKAAPFGQKAPQKSDIIIDSSKPDDTPLVPAGSTTVTFSEWSDNDIAIAEDLPDAGKKSAVLNLDGSYDKVLPDSWVVIDTGAVDKTTFIVGPVSKPLLIARTTKPMAGLSRTAYRFTGPTTRVDLVDPLTGQPANWIQRNTGPDEGQFQMIRRTQVYLQSEELPMAEAPIDDPLCGGASEDDDIELDGLYSDLKSGRWLVVSGDRSDIESIGPGPTDVSKPIEGIKSSELVMLAQVEHRFNPVLPGDKTHTFIRLAKKLGYCYRRDKVKIYANVVKATHGETRNEALGSGDATKPFQSFTLRQPPLTYVASPTPAGAESTLKVFVNDVRWRQTDTLAALGPADRKFITRTDDEGLTTVVFGTGERGARLPTGSENIRAVYRNGIGKAANVRAEQISLLLTRPLGVKEVINPLRASGGADKEARDQARKNAPLTVMALDRLVSTEDYADFARTFAGIAKSVAARLSDGHRELVHVTIAGADDIPIDESSDLFRNLSQALRQFGDPFQPVKIEVRELIFLVISAGVHILPDYLWDPVVTKVRARLLDVFSFERRELGQDVVLSEVISTIQSVEGVDYVDVDVMGGVSGKVFDPATRTRRLRTPKEILDTVQTLKTAEPRIVTNRAGIESGVIRPAQLAYLTPETPETLILNQLETPASKKKGPPPPPITGKP